MSTNEEKMTLAEIVHQMEDLREEIRRLHNLIKGARIMRDATIKEMPESKLHLFNVFYLAIEPLEKDFDEACEKHTALYNLSIGKSK